MCKTLHQCGVVHGDIKMENILIFNSFEANVENWQAKIADFGHAILDLENVQEGLVSKEVVGTPLYRPPELETRIKRLPPNSIASADIWCWGMLLWRVMIDGTHYFDEHGDRLLDQQMHDSKARLDFASNTSRCVMQYLNRRYSRQDAALIQLICNLLEDTLAKDPISRPSAEDLLTYIKLEWNRGSRI